MTTLRLSEASQRDFDRKPFRFQHDLARHEALQFASLREVVLSLPAEQVFASRADLSIDTDFDRAHIDHATGRSLEATLADMARTNAYVMVRNPDAHPRLRPVLELLSQELRDYVRRASGQPATGRSSTTRCCTCSSPHPTASRRSTSIVTRRCCCSCRARRT